MGGMNKYAEMENLKGLSSEIGWAESGIIRQISFKGRGAGICNWFRPSPSRGIYQTIPLPAKTNLAGQSL
jgi:hypothetical protein